MAPKVSVLLITYNHEAYIRQCLDGILSQKVDFDFEVVVGEDKSTDSTLSILLEYQQKYPGKIFIVSPPENMGAWYNWQRTVSACNGKYIAITDGDDYWISDDKLQKQANLLDLHPDYAMCFHDVEFEEQGARNGRSVASFAEGSVFTIRDVIMRGWFIGTCSMMITRSSMPKLPDWTKHITCLDIAVQLHVATKGDVGYVPGKMGVYRIHRGGISQGQWRGSSNALWTSHFDLFTRFDKSTNGKYRPYIKFKLGRIHKELMNCNPVTSKAYLSAFVSLTGLGPAIFMPLFKDWIISLVPIRMYEKYKFAKAQVSSKGA